MLTTGCRTTSKTATSSLAVHLTAGLKAYHTMMNCYNTQQNDSIICPAES